MKTLLNYLGFILIIFSGFFLLPIIAAIIYNESFLPFIIPMIISFSVGFFLNRLIRRKSVPNEKISFEALTFTDGLQLTAIAFLALSLISLIPFLFAFTGNPFSVLVNSFFEASSGITTTGLTVIQDLSIIPKSILFWRSETQWIGGIGIVLVVLLIINHLQKRSMSETVPHNDIQSSVMLYKVTLPEKSEPSLRNTALSIIRVYGIYTLLGIILLAIVGLPFYEAITITFTSLSTGGFTVKNAFYTNPIQLLIIGLLMIIGATSFLRHNELFKKRFKEFFKNIELRLFLILITISISLSLFVFKDFKIIVFQLLSAFTTTGYSIVNINLLPQLLLFFIMLGMIVGGQIGSTSGGIKLYRFLLIIKSIPWFTKKLSMPKDAVIPFKINKKPIEESIVLNTQILVAFYFIFMVIGSIFFMVLGYSFFDSSFQIISALGTVGLNSMPIYTVPVVGKLLLILAMFLGRLEIFPVLVFMHRLLRRN